MRHVIVWLYVLVVGFPLASWAGLNRARAVRRRQVADFNVADALPPGLHPVTRPFGPIVSETLTLPCSLLSRALGG